MGICLHHIVTLWELLWEPSYHDAAVTPEFLHRRKIKVVFNYGFLLFCSIPFYSIHCHFI